MPIYNAKCKKCGSSKRIVSDDVGWENVPVIKKACKCGYLMFQAPTGPSTRKMEKLDNGAMVRAVVRDADAEEIMRERAANADPLAGQKNYS